MEAATCQPYVSARINEIVSCGGRVHKPKRFRAPGTSRYLYQATEQVQFRSIPVDAHATVSFAGRSPDMPCYHGDLRSACAITLLGDVKGCGPRNKYFPDVEVGHILDMATDLMIKEQFTRTLLYCFLTDGYRFQFFRCCRSQRGESFAFEQSAVYGGEVGWQILFGLLISSIEELGFVNFEVPGWQILNGLGQGSFSTVFSCRPIVPAEENNDVFVLKVFRGNTKPMAEAERQVLMSLSHGGVSNVPLLRELHNDDEFSALVLTPLGVPVLPCPVGVIVTPAMLLALLQVVEQVHRLGWIHRDIKPDNIYLDHRHTAIIVLNDWSSAARTGIECAYVGTPLFGDRPHQRGRTHIPDARLDLRSLVKTALCMSKQFLPNVEDDDDAAIQQYWTRIQQQFPTFQRALALADAIQYEALRDALAAVW